jgi:O-methyltransferase involved in polyketide biosynthesis
MDTLVEGFLKQSNDSGKKAQIVSLGAGSDTRFWRLSVRTVSPKATGLHYEADLHARVDGIPEEHIIHVH